MRRHILTAITLEVLRGLDLTTVASAAIDKTDLDSAVNDALGRLDVDEIADELWKAFPEGNEAAVPENQKLPPQA